MALTAKRASTLTGIPESVIKRDLGDDVLRWPLTKANLAMPRYNPAMKAAEAGEYVGLTSHSVRHYTNISEARTVRGTFHDGKWWFTRAALDRFAAMPKAPCGRKRKSEIVG